MGHAVSGRLAIAIYCCVRGALGVAAVAVADCSGVCAAVAATAAAAAASVWGFLPAEHIHLDHHLFDHQQQLHHHDEFIDVYFYHFNDGLHFF